MKTRVTDIKVVGAELYFLPVETRVPLKFGLETTTFVTCARVRLTVHDAAGRAEVGWGETPLSVQWVWPGGLPYETRQEALKEFCLRLAEAWTRYRAWGHPLEVGYRFQENCLTELLSSFNQTRPPEAAMPWLAALVCCSPFDLALHDAYGRLQQRPVYDLYNAELMNRDLSYFFRSDATSRNRFQDKFPDQFLLANPPQELRAWHLVGGLDPIEASDLTGAEPCDGYPVLLEDWIDRDGLKCLKVKLRGTDPDWDFQRLLKVGRLAVKKRVEWLSADFNCTVTDPAYVTDLLDRLRDDHPRLYGMILYVEQPFPYELEQFRIDVHAVASRKPLFLDESAHDWRMVKLGQELGWTGVALKTCKTQTGAILSCCWAKAHGLTLMVQDLTNPMLAQIPHVLLAAHAGTIMGVETNAMQFYPEASRPEAAVHPGLYQRRSGLVDWSTLQGPGFGYRLKEIQRRLPEPVLVIGG
jgi:L-alanine-DL-glutamate epimerase-like enolase superfamily enzyme